MNNGFDDSGDQFVLSRELVELMEWIVRNDQAGMKKLVDKALSHGLDKKIKQSSPSFHARSIDDAECSVLDFFELMEQLLQESTQERMVSSVMQKSALPIINQIDTSACDPAMVQSSAASVSSKLKKSPDKNAQEMLYKEILRRWEPDSNQGAS